MTGSSDPAGLFEQIKPDASICCSQMGCCTCSGAVLAALDVWLKSQPVGLESELESGGVSAR